MKKNKLMGPALLAAALTPAPAAPPQRPKPAAPKPTQGRARQQEAERKRAARAELEKKVRQIVVDELGVDENEVTPNARFIDDLGADSLDTVELVMRFEEEFGIEIPDEDAGKIKSVRDAYDYLDKSVNERGGKPAPTPGATPAPDDRTRPAGPTSLVIGERLAGDVLILDVGGEFTGLASSVELRQTLARLLLARHRKFLLNLSGLRLSDSKGASALTSGAQLVRRVRGQLKLLNPTPAIRELLAAENLSDAFALYEDEAEAVASFETPARRGVGPQESRGARAFATQREVGEFIRELMDEKLRVNARQT